MICTMICTMSCAIPIARVTRLQGARVTRLKGRHRRFRCRMGPSPFRAVRFRAAGGAMRKSPPRRRASKGLKSSRFVLLLQCSRSPGYLPLGRASYSPAHQPLAIPACLHHVPNLGVQAMSACIGRGGSQNRLSHVRWAPEISHSALIHLRHPHPQEPGEGPLPRLHRAQIARRDPHPRRCMVQAQSLCLPNQGEWPLAGQ